MCEYKEKVQNPTYKLCPAGFYCYYDSLNNYKLVQNPCPAGYYNPNRGSTSISACLNCPAGYYCPPGTEFPVSCTPGAYCPVNTESNQQYKCAAGYYLDIFNA